MSGCVFRDSELGIDSTVTQLTDLVPTSDAMPDFTSQGDPPFHWRQGAWGVDPMTSPAPAPAPPPTPTPAPAPPTSGWAIATADLNLRSGPGTGYRSKGAIPLGEWVEVRRAHAVTGSPWRRVRWNDLFGWVHGGWLAAEAKAADTAPVAWELRWYFAGSVEGDEEAIGRAIEALWIDARSWGTRCGIRVTRVAERSQAHVEVAVTASPCGGAPACWSYRGTLPARIEIGAAEWNENDHLGASWWPRRVNHELGHHFSIYDMYSGSRGEALYAGLPYQGVMGNLSDSAGKHLWPDEDECASVRSWLLGQAPKVVAR